MWTLVRLSDVVSVVRWGGTACVMFISYRVSSCCICLENTLQRPVWASCNLCKMLEMCCQDAQNKAVTGVVSGVLRRGPLSLAVWRARIREDTVLDRLNSLTHVVMQANVMERAVGLPFCMARFLQFAISPRRYDRLISLEALPCRRCWKGCRFWLVNLKGPCNTFRAGSENTADR